MGFFANLYLVEAEADSSGGIVTTSVFGAESAPLVYFSWVQGVRDEHLYPYGDGTVFSNAKLDLLPGYPVRERFGESENNDPNRFLLEASFQPRAAADPVLFHLVLPPRFVPQPDQEPFDQPSKPFAYSRGDRLVVTYPTVGGGAIRYWVRRLPAGESFDSYDLNRAFTRAEQRPARFEFELNLGICKLKVS